MPLKLPWKKKWRYASIPLSAVVFDEDISYCFIIYFQHPVTGLEDSITFWARIKQERLHARHHCWAAIAKQAIRFSTVWFS